VILLFGSIEVYPMVEAGVLHRVCHAVLNMVIVMVEGGGEGQGFLACY